MAKTIKCPTLFRSFEIDRAMVDKEKRTVSLSFSSEHPVERWFGTEILDHNPKSVRMGRMASGAPLLVNHNQDEQVGVVEEAKIEGNTGRATVRFGTGARASEIFADVTDGIRRSVSVGYRIYKVEKTGTSEGKVETVRVTDWEPLEVSLVPVPADPNVGVGRANAPEYEIEVSETEPQNQKRSMAENITVDVVQERKSAIQAERSRLSDLDTIAGLSRKFNPEGVDAALAKAKAGDTSPAQFRAEIFPLVTNAKPVTTEPTIGLSERDLKSYSLVRAINGSIGAMKGQSWSGLERECSAAVEKIVGRGTQGFYIPHDVMQARALTTNVFSAAGAFVESGAQGQSLIELYRNKMHVVALGARVLTGLQGNLAIPSQTGGATASWLSEDATITASSQTVGQVALTPHRLAAATAFTYQLLAQSSVDVENFVRNDLMTVLAVEKDRAALKGSGVSGEPLGIYLTANKSTSVTLAGANSMTYANAVQFETNVATNNADLGSLGYLVSVATKGNAKLIAEISSTNSNPVWKSDMVNGYPARATNQLTTLPSVIFGNWSDLIIGDWASNEVIVDPYSLSLQGQVRIVMQQLSDVAIRHAKSFSISTT